MYLARLENRRVAMKVLCSRGKNSGSPSDSPDSGIGEYTENHAKITLASDDELELAFEREMRVLGALRHPNVVEVSVKKR